MSFTLKITDKFSSSSPITWISNVVLVTYISQGTREQMNNKQHSNGGAYPDFMQFADHSPENATLSLLYVQCDESNESHSGYYVVQTAYLLGPDGKTIERIAP